jgi:pimeloyl-ACP methyl ester carboxylesterase
VPKNYSLTLRRNTIWYDSHCVENYLKALNTPILLLHSTKIDKQNGRVPIKNLDDIPYINFIKLWTENTRLKIFEETGHYITIEEPEIVNKQITEWLESLKIHLR